MGKVLTTLGISAIIEKIIIEANLEHVLISPYISISKTFKERLYDAKANRIIVVYGKEKMEKDKRNELYKIPNLELYFCENLHAKVYYNEFEMIHTSMNLHKFSEKNNRETGILFSANEKEYSEGKAEAESILRSSKRERRTNVEKLNSIFDNTFMIKENFDVNRIVRKGFCIRCRKSKGYNPEYPYCKECYEIWDQFGNASYTENFCHCCGKENRTSMNKPECYTCYRNGG